MKLLEEKATGYRYDAIQFTKENQFIPKEFLGKTATIYVDKTSRIYYTSDGKTVEDIPHKTYFTSTYIIPDDIKKNHTQELFPNDWIVKKVNGFEIHSDDKVRNYFNILDVNDSKKDETKNLDEIFSKQADIFKKHNIIISDSSVYKLTLNKYIFLEDISIGITTDFLRQLNDYINNGFITLTENPTVYIGEYPNPVIAFMGNRTYCFGAFDLQLESGNWTASIFRFDSEVDFLNQLKIWNYHYKIYLLKINVGKYIEVRLIKIPGSTLKCGWWC